MTYVDGILTAVLTEAVDPTEVFTLQPARLLQSLPCLVAKHLPGGPAVDVRFSSTRATVQLDGYHPDKRGAYDLTASAVAALVHAWRTQTVTPDGVIAGVTSQADPAELRLDDQASGFTRYTATLTLLCRTTA